MLEDVTQRQVPARLVARRHRLLRELGRGGIGTVWLAEDQLTGRQVAVKELRPPQGLAVATLTPLSAEGTFSGPPLPPLYWFAFSPSSATLAVADGTGDVRLWDTATHKVVATASEPEGAEILALAVSPDGKTLITTDQDDQICVWNVAGSS